MFFEIVNTFQCMKLHVTVIEDSARALWTLMNELYDVRAKWKQIGLGLFFPESDLDAISGTPQECLQKLLSKWLKRLEPLPTWDRLVAVLRSRVIGEEKKAQELEEKFCDAQKHESVTPTHSDTAAIPTPGSIIRSLHWCLCIKFILPQLLTTGPLLLRVSLRQVVLSLALNVKLQVS